MNQYQFEQIIRRTSKRFGKIPKGGENPYNTFFFTIEGNLLKVNRAHPECDSRCMLEAIPLALWAMEDRLEGRHSDTSAFENPENLLLKHAILMAFDPFTNEEVAALVRERTGSDTPDQAVLNRIYGIPAKVLVRLQESVKIWMEIKGLDGYFVYLRGSIGPHVSRDDKMKFTIQALS